MLRGDKFIKFSRNFKSVTITPNASFLAKNEAPGFRRQPMKLVAIFKRGGLPHPLCPVNTLRLYLNLTRNASSDKLFVNPLTLNPCNKARIVYCFRKLIRFAQPGVYAKFHDLRIMSSWVAFWDSMSWSNLKVKGFWKTTSALGKHYLSKSFPVKGRCMALGRWSN